jgi:hypothetical protein
MSDHLNIPCWQMLGGPCAERTIVATIGPQLTNAWKARGNAIQQEFSAFPIRNVGSVYQHRNDETHGIHQQMPFAPVDLLAAIKSPLWATHGCACYTPDFLVLSQVGL